MEGNSSLSGDEELYEVPASLVAFLSVCYVSISVAAVVGNGLVIWVIATSRRMRNVTNYYIANLALADIVIGLFAIPFEFQAALLQRWVLPHFMCPFCPFIKVLSISVSVFTLSAIALDRYRAILKPLKNILGVGFRYFTHPSYYTQEITWRPQDLYAPDIRARVSRTQFRLVVSMIWLTGAIMGTPMAIALRVVTTEPDNVTGEVVPFCHNVNLSEEAMQWYHGIMVLVQYFIPLTVIVFAYARVGLELWGSRAPGNAQTDRDANLMRNKKKVIKMLVIVVALFVLCWLPLQTYNLLQYITEINSYKYINIFWFGFDWLAMSNSCYNPFIYAIYNEKFKREFQVRLRLPCLKEKQQDVFGRELSGFESAKSEWTRASTIVNINGIKTLPTN